MITMIEIIRAVSALVEDLFGAPPTTKDVTEGFDRPSTYIQPGQMSTAMEGDLRHDSFSLDIIRFGEQTRTGYLDLLKAMNNLADALEQPLPVEDSFFLYPEDVEFELLREEMVLITSLRVENYQEAPDCDTSELMDTLILQRKD